ncbi:MAG: hypothetical protein HYZ14_00430 [Bacteroidetes bacterium]|nr:hypothetical protein [Bacteroidota bacterium]
MAEHIPIKKSRLRLTGILYAFLALVSLAGFFMLADQVSDNWALALKITGGVLAVLFVLTGAGALKSLNDKNAGLHINTQGFADHSTSIGVGQVSWKNVRSLEVDEKEKLIRVILKNPADVIKSAQNKAIRQLLERNNQIYKTPVILESKYLDCSFSELAEKMQNRFQPGSKKTDL